MAVKAMPSPLKRNCLLWGPGNVLEDGSISAAFRRGKKLYGETPACKNNCFLFDNVLSPYYVEDFWGLAGDTIRRG